MIIINYSFGHSINVLSTQTMNLVNLLNGAAKCTCKASCTPSSSFLLLVSPRKHIEACREASDDALLLFLVVIVVTLLINVVKLGRITCSESVVAFFFLVLMQGPLALFFLAAAVATVPLGCGRLPGCGH